MARDIGKPAWPAIIAVLGATAAPATGLPPAAQHDRPAWLAAASTRLRAAPMRIDQGAPAATAKGREQRLAAASAEWRQGDYRLSLGLDYQYTRYEYTGIDGRNRDLHRLQLPLRFRNTGSDWRVRGYVAPGVATSSNVFNQPLERWTRNDLVVSAAIEAGRPLSRRWRWLTGLAYDRRFGSPQLYPLAGVRYRSGDGLAVRLAFPDSALQQVIGERSTLALRIRPAGARWHVVSDELAMDFGYRVQGIRGDVTLSFRLWADAILDLRLGYEAGRRHRLTDDTAARLHAAVDDQWLFAIGLRSAGAPALP